VKSLSNAAENYHFQGSLFDEVSHYHDAGRRGFFAICQRPDGSELRQKSYRLDLLPKVLSRVNPKIDTYMSQCEFTHPNRCKVNLARIPLCFVDLDYYAAGSYMHHRAAQMAGAILQHCEDNGIPEPSVIMHSGRGCYLKWFFTSPIPRAALPRWDALQGEFVRRFSDFGADIHAKDASRILRVENTVNMKSGEVCRVLWPTQASPVHYDFEMLCREVLPVDRDLIRNPPKPKVQLTLHQGGNKPGLRPLSAIRLNWDRLADLRTLVALRGPVPVGQRDEFLFLAACFASWVVAPATLRLEVDSLAREFVPSLPFSQVRGYTSSAIRRAELASQGQSIIYNGQVRDPRYYFTNAALIDLLKITRDEERVLKTIISKGEAKERDAERKRQYRAAHGATDRDTYLEGAEQRRIEAILRRAKGESVATIAEALGVTRMTVHRYLADSR